MHKLFVSHSLCSHEHFFFFTAFKLDCKSVFDIKKMYQHHEMNADFQMLPDLGALWSEAVLPNLSSNIDKKITESQNATARRNFKI